MNIPMDVIKLVVCIDAAFAVNKDDTSQLGAVAMLRNELSGEENVIHYLSVKSKRVCKRVLATEILAMVDVFDIGYCLKDSLQWMTGNYNVE